MKRVFLLFAIVVLGMSIYGQCPIEQTNSVGSSMGTPEGDPPLKMKLGQRFKPTCSGEIVSIAVMIGSDAAVTNATLSIYDNITDPPTVNARTYSEDFSISTTAMTEEVLTLSTPYPVNSGQDYVFVLKDRDDTEDIVLIINFPITYADGSYYYEDVGIHGYNTVELWFKINITSTGGATTPLSPFAVIAALALIGFAGLWIIKR